MQLTLIFISTRTTENLSIYSLGELEVSIILGEGGFVYFYLHCIYSWGHMQFTESVIKGMSSFRGVGMYRGVPLCTARMIVKLFF